MSAQSWTVRIPAPAHWLNANQRIDLRRQTPARRAWRDAAHLYARQVKLPKLGKAHIVAEHPDDGRVTDDLRQSQRQRPAHAARRLDDVG